MKFQWTVSPQVNARARTNDTHAHAGTNESHAHAGTKMRHARAREGAGRFGHVVMQTQARDALVGLGWKPGIARAAVEEAIAGVGVDVSIDVLIREALRRCPKPLA